MKRQIVYLFFLVFVFSAFCLSETAAQVAGEGYTMKKIVLDAGHGGRDAGCVNGNHKEKDIVLAVVLRVGELVKQNLPDVEVVYTRKTDVFVELLERGNIANRQKADLFVSVHADAVASSSPRGSSSWVMGLSKEESNLQLAMRENSVITYEEDYQTRYEGFDPNDPASYIMFSLQQSAHFDQSIRLATLFQKHYGQNTNIPTHRGVKQNTFIVLHRTTMPSVLTEIGFLSNAADRAVMTTRQGREKIARSIFNAISEYKSQVEGNATIVTLDPESGSQPASPVTVPAAASPSGQPARNNTPASITSADRSGTVFRIQVMAATRRENTRSSSRFGEYAGKVYEKRIGNYYKYFVGETNSYSEALSLQRQAKNRFRDAFIVAFRNDSPVTITDEMKRN